MPGCYKDYLVRANACDSVGMFRDDEVLRQLIYTFEHDENAIVRAYGLFSIGDIMEGYGQDEKLLYMKNLQDAIQGEKSLHVKIAAYAVSCRLGEECYIGKLLSLLRHDDYIIRCSVLHCLQDIVNDKNKEDIRRAIAWLKARETSQAVLSAAGKPSILIS